jgi:hypothetical protein
MNQQEPNSYPNRQRRTNPEDIVPCEARSLSPYSHGGHQTPDLQAVGWKIEPAGIVTILPCPLIEVQLRHILTFYTDVSNGIPHNSLSHTLTTGLAVVSRDHLNPCMWFSPAA